MNKKRSTHKQVTKIIDYKATFGTEEGKRVLYDLLKISGMLMSNFDENALNMAFKEGQRNIVLHIFGRLKIDVKQLAEFIEQQEEE